MELTNERIDSIASQVVETLEKENLTTIDAARIAGRVLRIAMDKLHYSKEEKGAPT